MTLINQIRWMVVGLFFTTAMFCTAFGQAECTAWGNVTGIRMQGHLVEFETTLCVVGETLMQATYTAKEKQRPEYHLYQNKQVITTQLDPVRFVVTVQDQSDGQAALQVEAQAESDSVCSGAFLCLELPSHSFSTAKMELIDSTALARSSTPLFPGERRTRGSNRIVQASLKGIRFLSPVRQLTAMVNEPTDVIILPGHPFYGSPHTRIYFSLLPGPIRKGQTAKKIFTMMVSGDIDKTPIHLVLEPDKPGRAFDGLGGNFRLQNPDKDPMVIDYCLKNLNIMWGRVEMPWSYWHAVESVDPLTQARAGRLHPGVADAMAMAQRLAKKKMPVIVSAWRAPAWAILGEFNRGQSGGLPGNPLNPAKMKSIVKSIASYLHYLKEAYGVEAALFSFNESDLGINVRQTGQEHAELIKSLGAFLASQGLATKMLLGDNSDATTYEFLTPAINDPETHVYLGAISFHSWRGCDDWTLAIWADAMKKLNVPLLVGEGSTDAAAYRYPDIFTQPAYALNEIALYLRMAAICQPRSILQWQLTSDYSVLIGEGIYHTEGRLRPTQRFWNLQQLGLTPSGSFHLPISCDRPNVSCAAFADIANGVYAIHLVNNGAERLVTLTGLPNQVKRLQLYVTDSKRGREKGQLIPVENDQARFILEPASFTSLISIP